MSQITPSIKNLVLSGGGSKGFAYFGVYQALTELDPNFMNHLESLAGTSAGAIMATLIALRYKPKDLYSFITSFDYNKLKSWDFLNILKNQGLETGEHIIVFIRKIIAHKIHPPKSDPTFQDLYDYHPYTLNIVVTHLNTYQMKVYNHLQTPDMSVAEAVRQSMSMPMMMTPMKMINSEDQTDYYVDGGLVNNFPIDLYPDADETFGVLVENTQERYEIANNEEYIYHVMMCGYHQMTQSKIQKYTQTRILQIDAGDISMTHFDLPYEQRAKLYQIGHQTTLKYFQTSENDDDDD